jgi:prepilin-type N-terminal cleavage/methylation domain-containing protein
MRSPRLGRAGFTLIELLVAMVLMGIIGAVTMRLMVNMQRGSRAQSQRVSLQGSMRAGISLLPSELREISAGDVLIADPDRIRYRAMRSAGVACAVTPTQVTLRNSLLFGYRPVESVRDGVFLFLDDDIARATDDTWIRLLVTGVTASACPDGAPATLLTVLDATTGVQMDAAVVAKVELQAPVRAYEVMEFRLYEADGRFWLGGQSISTVGSQVEPVLGPLTADGLLFTYRDRTGAATGVLGDIRTIEIALNGETEGAISNGSYNTIVEDSLTARVRLRNAPAF